MNALLKGDARCCLDIDGRSYKIDFMQLLQTNVRTKKNRKVRCQFGFPAHWHMSNEDVLKKVLQERHEGSSCWSSFLQNLFCPSPATPLTFCPAPWETIQKVTDPQMLLNLADLLNKSTMRQDGATCSCRQGRSFQLKEAYQVKNLYLWRRYQRCVQSISDKHKQYAIQAEKIDPPPGDALMKFAEKLEVNQISNEGLFFHGTRSMERAQQIAKEGFDNRVAANSGLYGKGTYFAVQSCKSAQYSRVQASFQAMGTMFLARVAMGDPYYTNRAYRDPRAL